MKNKILTYLDKQWEYLNTYTEESPKAIEAKKELRDLYFILPMALMLLLGQYVIVSGLHIENLGGTFYIFVASTYLYFILVYATLHIKKVHKHH